MASERVTKSKRMKAESESAEAENERVRDAGERRYIT
jgi:hypothetical protein